MVRCFEDENIAHVSGRIDPLDRSYDIVFSYYEGDLPDSGRVARRVFELPRGIFASPQFLEKYPKIRTPQDLAEVPAIASPADAEWTFTDATGAHSVPVRARMRSPNADVRRRAEVAAGDAVTVSLNLR